MREITNKIFLIKKKKTDDESQSFEPTVSLLHIYIHYVYVYLQQAEDNLSHFLFKKNIYI